MEYFDRSTPAENRLFSGRLTAWMVAIALGVGLLAWVLSCFPPNRPVEYESDLDHFRYGSIGSDISGGLPVKVLQVLPAAFPQYLPPGAQPNLTAFGFIQEPGHALPIGFSTRRQLIDRTAMNCAACHTGVVRKNAEDGRIIIPGMPAETVDLHAYFRFLFDVAADENFTARTILTAMRQQGILEPLDPLIYRFVIPRMRDALLAREKRNAFLFDKDYPRFGPGRVNTFDTFKVDQFRYYYRKHGVTPAPDEMFGNVDFPSVWNQRPREGLKLHWDGNQTSVRERNFSAAIGAGAKPSDMDIDSLFRVENWLKDLPPPAYPFPIDADLAARGAAIYADYCAACHDFGGAQLAEVMPLSEIGTDPYRNWSYTPFLLKAQQDYTKGYFWAFRNFSKTDGYSSHPLDGIWARAPYLHNGSVPSMADLLTPEDERPAAFELGVSLYDPVRMGFAAERLRPVESGFLMEGGAPYAGHHFILDTRLKGNSARGHSGAGFGTGLSPEEKTALIEYLKTL